MSNEDDFQPGFDPRAVRAGFARRATAHGRNPFFYDEVRQRMFERLALIRLQPERIVDLGCGPGQGAAALMRHYPRAAVLAVDMALPMLGRVRRQRGWWRRQPWPVAAEATALPLADASVDMVFSSLMLPWCEPERVFRECARVLRPGGLLMFSSLGPDSLVELRQAWALLDDYTHINPFMDMHDVGDALVRAGLADPVMDVENLTLEYASLAGLWADLRVAGAGNLNRDRPPGLRGSGILQALARLWPAEGGRRQLTMEVVQGHAWAPETPLSRNTGGGEAHFPISRLGRR